MTKCPGCEGRRLNAGGNCRYCARIREKVTPGRVDMAGPLRRYLLLSIVLYGAVYLGRIGIFAHEYSLLTDLQRGDAGAIDHFRTDKTLFQLDSLVLFVVAVCDIQALMKWLDASNANALTRPDIGARWIRRVPGSARFWRWRRATLVMLVLTMVVGYYKPNDLESLRERAVLQIVCCVGFLVAMVGQHLSLRKMDGDLRAWLESPVPETPVAEAAEPVG